MGMRAFCVGLVEGALLVAAFIAGGYYARQETDALIVQAEEQVYQARLTSKLLLDSIETSIANYEEEAENAKKTIDQLRADVRNSNRRLSVAVRSCSQSNHPGTGSGQARAELDPAAAERIIAITEDGDAAIRKLNRCIDQYNLVRDKINDKTSE